ncbi:MAG: SpoIIE family protein phosphatase, partial [Flavobacteriales bacterium]|nr:SpoIIE family protein phosphatase [Flavobacteriales bacterium]
DSRGVLWVGTQRGLCRLNASSDAFDCFDEEDGLPNSFIYGILEDTEGNLWISTNRGISELDTSQMSFTNYDIYDGLQDYEFNNNACHRTRSGEMYFAGPRGLNRFSPASLPVNAFVPPIEITDIKVLNKPIENELETAMLKQLTLSYFENILSFEFSALDFTNPTRNQYQYKMDGFNNDWSPMDVKRFTTYTNLDPGHYVFRVKGTNSDGVWNEEVASIEIDILPPFWKTNWFYVLCLVVVITVIYLIYKARVRALVSSKRVLEHQVKLRTQEVVMQKDELEEINGKLAETNSELEKLSIVASETDNAVVIMNEKTEFEWANEGFTKLSGYTLEQFKEERGETLVGTSSNEAIKDLVNQCITEKRSVVYETMQRKITGEEFWVQSTLTPIFDNGGAITRLVDINTDITKRKLAEELVKEKNQDITSSIKYAKQIQEAILPLRENFQKRFPESFILYKPKDIVSGDFYWMSAKNKFTMVAACDCTGHGVPGAFMSMIGNSLLNEIVNVRNITEPAKVLNMLRDEIINALKQQKSFHLGEISDEDDRNEVKDGMDAVLCKIDMNNLTVEYAGAYNPLYIIRKKIDPPELEETKGDKWPIGVWLGDYQQFTNHKIQLERGDTIYMFSDGYIDQFGGPRGKKFRAAKFRQLLLSVVNESMQRQGEILDQTLIDWQGDIEQVDDILVIGIRI